MMKWLCALMLLVFSATVASAAHAPPMPPLAKAVAVQDAVFVSAGAMEAMVTAPCCPETLSKPGAAMPCSVDCSFLPASCDINIPAPRPGHGGTETPFPRWFAVEAELRPPII